MQQRLKPIEAGKSVHAVYEVLRASILDGTPLPVLPEDAVANLRVIEQVFTAAERRH